MPRSYPCYIDDPELEAKRAQKQLVDQLFERLDGLAYASYERPEQFEKLLEGNLRSLLHNLLRGMDSPVGARDSPADVEVSWTVPAAYREWVKNETSSVELLGLGDSLGRSLFLSSVYVPLITAASQESLGRSASLSNEEPMEQPTLLLDALERQSGIT